MTTESKEFSGLPGYLWTPEKEPRAIVLVIHGMTEHAGRYERFGGYLAAHGIGVAAFDLRGHGRNAADSDCAAMAPGDWQESIGDIGRAIRQIREWYEGPLYLLGFSLGSFLVREYMQRESIPVDGIILIGTGWQPRWLLKLMQAIVRSQIKKAGYRQTTELVRQLSFGAYNRKFKPNRTNSDWLCSDERELDRYLADALCKGDIAAGTFHALLSSMERTAAHLPECGSNARMPILLLSGEQDPVGSFGKGVAAVNKQLTGAGYPVSLRTFSGARHMLLAEEANGQAVAARETILGWIESHI